MKTEGAGEVSASWTYPVYDWPEDYKAHAVTVKVKPGQDARVRHIVSRPVMLKVGIKTH